MKLEASIAAGIAVVTVVGSLFLTPTPAPPSVLWPLDTFTLARVELSFAGPAYAVINPAVSPRLFHDRLIVPTLRRMNIYTPELAQLLLATAVTESILYYSRQVGNGPALGYFQMEPATHSDIWRRYLSQTRNAALAAAVRRTLPCDDCPVEAVDMVLYPAYGVAMAAAHYLRVGKPLPALDDAAGMAQFWKRWYNTRAGRGTVEHFLAVWERFDLGAIL